MSAFRKCAVRVLQPFCCCDRINTPTEERERGLMVAPFRHGSDTRQRQAGLGSRSERLTDYTASVLREQRVTGSVLN